MRDNFLTRFGGTLEEIGNAFNPDFKREEFALKRQQPMLQEVGNILASEAPLQQKQMALAQIGTPVAFKALEQISGLQGNYANPGGATGHLIQRLMESTGMSFEEALYAVQTGNRQGTQLQDGTIVPMANAPAALSQLSQGKESGRQQAILDYTAPIATTRSEIDLQYKPVIAGQEAEARLGAEAKGVVNKKAVQAKNVLDLIKEAELILPQASGGLLQAGATAASRASGISTERSKADSKLETIAAGLVSNVPRMEGPQSNYDVKLYQQAAGDIANSKIPIGDRQAALDIIKTLQQKYVDQNTPNVTPNAAPPMNDVDFPSELPDLPGLDGSTGTDLKNQYNAVMNQGILVETLPPAAKFKGITKDGKKLYETPDGDQFVEE